KARLGDALGARAETFLGLSGLGDILLTATGDLSRNRRTGMRLAAGLPLAQVLSELGHVAEGVPSAPMVLARARALGISDPTRKYSVEEMAKGDVMFAATGVTSGAMLRGVRRFAGGAYTHSIVMRSKSGTVRYVEGHHNFARKPSAFIA
ncbi:MAG: fructose-bisphosphatase class II, partial [Alphaproteobacteria bacterium]